MNMESLLGKTVGEIVASNYKTADVFKKYGIDFCCGGKVGLAEVCNQKSISLADIENDLKNLANQTENAHDFDRWQPDFLVDYIVNQHHTYVRENIPVIVQYAQKVARVHGENHPETIEINQLFQEVAMELDAHLQKEEKILFPYIKQLMAAKNESNACVVSPFGTIANPIKMMEAEHETAGDIFKKIDALSDNYTPPATACNTYRVLYAKLQEFETDLHKHVHLENNILFPKALRLQKSSS